VVKIGFIGFGKFSQVRLKALCELEDINIVGYFDPLLNKESQGVQRFENIDDLLTKIDAVIISVPPNLAPDYVVKALMSKLHVFCEKPAAVSASELSKIENYISGDQVLAYGFNHRQHQSIIKMKSIIDEKLLGNILWMRGRYGKEVGEDYRDSWRCDLTLNGGGILIDQGVHMVDLMSYLAGGFNGAQAVLSNRYLNKEGIDDNGFVTLFSTNTKISASIHTTITQWRYLFSLEVFLEKGSMILNGLKTNSGRYGDEILSIKPSEKFEGELETSDIHYTSNVSWKEEMRAFAGSVKNSTPYPYANYKDALETTRIIDLIYREAIWL
jgi:1,5-anhydro-D-fructose reductase (1,5-anhydro-D-mannitol-forming)